MHISHKVSQAIMQFNGQPVYYVDGIPMVIKHIHDNVAVGYVINQDLTTKDCYVAKGHGMFAHGDSIKEAAAALEEKIISSMNVDEKIDQFVEKFKLDEEYDVKDFYSWHHILTGSCEFGRKSFMQDHGISMDGKATTKYFLDITKNAFGSSVIQKIREKFKLPN